MTMTAAEELVVRTKAGNLRGACENGIAVFRGVPFAAGTNATLSDGMPALVPDGDLGVVRVRERRRRTWR